MEMRKNQNLLSSRLSDQIETKLRSTIEDADCGQLGSSQHQERFTKDY